MSLKMKLQSLGIESCNLDSVVDAAAQREAERVNNEGMKDQLEYLLQQGMTESEILDALGLE